MKKTYMKPCTECVGYVMESAALYYATVEGGGEGKEEDPVDAREGLFGDENSLTIRNLWDD